MPLEAGRLYSCSLSETGAVKLTSQTAVLESLKIPVSEFKTSHTLSKAIGTPLKGKGTSFTVTLPDKVFIESWMECKASIQRIQQNSLLNRDATPVRVLAQYLKVRLLLAQLRFSAQRHLNRLYNLHPAGFRYTGRSLLSSCSWNSSGASTSTM